MSKLARRNGSASGRLNPKPQPLDWAAINRAVTEEDLGNQVLVRVARAIYEARIPDVEFKTGTDRLWLTGPHAEAMLCISHENELASIFIKFDKHASAYAYLRKDGRLVGDGDPMTVWHFQGENADTLSDRLIPLMLSCAVYAVQGQTGAGESCATCRHQLNCLAFNPKGDLNAR